MKIALVMALFLVGCGSEDEQKSQIAAVEAVAAGGGGSTTQTCENPPLNKEPETIKQTCELR